MYQRILVPTDGSELAAVAVDAAIAFARACGADLVALSVACPEPVLLSAEGAIAAGAESGVDVLLEQARHYVTELADAARRAGVECTALTAYGYSPADEIIDVAKRRHCDLIFIASHGRRGLSRLIAGSVTQRVLACSPVPVMVYRPPMLNEKGRGAPDIPPAPHAAD
jgi:nucleotide-binding universal stress UspA family protein